MIEKTKFYLNFINYALMLGGLWFYSKVPIEYVVIYGFCCVFWIANHFLYFFDHEGEIIGENNEDDGVFSEMETRD